MAECEAFNVVNRGMCKAPLEDRGECPRQGEHGDEFDVPDDDGFRAAGVIPPESRYQPADKEL